MQSRIMREIKAMKKLSHPHIISLYQVMDLKSDYYLAMELAPKGDLFDHLTKVGKVSSTYILLLILRCFIL